MASEITTVPRTEGLDISFAKRVEARAALRRLSNKGATAITNEGLFEVIRKTIDAKRKPEETSSPTSSVQLSDNSRGWEEDLKVILDNPDKDKRIIFSKDQKGKVSVSVVKGIHTDQDRKVTTNGLTNFDKTQILVDLLTSLTTTQNFKPISQVVAPLSPPSQPRLIP